MLGVDVFPENRLKTVGTIAEYGRTVPPASVGLDPETLQCVAKPDELYRGLDGMARERAARSEAHSAAGQDGHARRVKLSQPVERSRRLGTSSYRTVDYARLVFRSYGSALSGGHVRP